MDWKFALERYDDIIEEMQPLLTLNFKETGYYQDFGLDIDHDKYRILQEHARLYCFTARETETRRLIGYAFFFVGTHPHHKSVLQAIQDVIFIDPLRRGFGLYFINKCDNFLKEIGVKAVYHHVPAKKDWAKVLERIGYEPVEQVYGKRLDK